MTDEGDVDPENPRPEGHYPRGQRMALRPR
jgi:hypothetical protein